MIKSSQILRYVAATLSLAFAFLGINGWWNQLSQCDTAGRLIQTFAQLGYGAVGLLVGGLLIAKRLVPKILEWSWIGTMTIAGGMAPIVWADSGILSGVAGAIAAMVIALGTIWLTRRVSRALTSRSPLENAGSRK